MSTLLCRREPTFRIAEAPTDDPPEQRAISFRPLPPDGTTIALDGSPERETHAFAVPAPPSAALRPTAPVVPAARADGVPHMPPSFLPGRGEDPAALVFARSTMLVPPAVRRREPTAYVTIAAAVALAIAALVIGILVARIAAEPPAGPSPAPAAPTPASKAMTAAPRVASARRPAGRPPRRSARRTETRRRERQLVESQPSPARKSASSARVAVTTGADSMPTRRRQPLGRGVMAPPPVAAVGVSRARPRAAAASPAPSEFGFEGSDD